MLKPRIAYAIVSKKRPSINIMEIYSKEQVKEIKIGKDEEMIEVVISPKYREVNQDNVGKFLKDMKVIVRKNIKI